jgi:hypothetical protein
LTTNVLIPFPPHFFNQEAMRWQLLRFRRSSLGMARGSHSQLRLGGGVVMLDRGEAACVWRAERGYSRARYELTKRIGAATVEGA